MKTNNGITGDVLKAIGLVSLIFAVIPLELTINGFVLYKLWQWIVVPTFDITQITVPVAIGLMTVISYVTHQSIDCEPRERNQTQRISRLIGLLICKPGFALGLGWILKTYFM